jgi:arsenical pump membrane protein
MIATLAIVAAATACVIARPFRLPEAVWAVGGAALLVATGLLPWHRALDGVGKGVDVYLFLAGMMLLSELAREQGLFDYFAALAVRLARGSTWRLFAIVYGIGTLVTAFMSNDATAVVLTPAVFAAAKAADARPLPHLFACAFVANAASFLLPISNPANLVLFGGHMPPLGQWLQWFALPSLAAIAATFAALAILQRRELAGGIGAGGTVPPLGRSGWATAFGLLATALVLLAASQLGWQLGLPTLAAALLTVSAVSTIGKTSPLKLAANISWAVIPLVAGLFVLVEGIQHIGLIDILRQHLFHAFLSSPRATSWGAGIGLAYITNIMNNLPAGLIAGSAAAGSQVPASVTGALLIGVDLGPNLSVTGSLATILWLTALRREGEHVDGWSFLKLGLVAMPAALLPALAIFTCLV